MQHCLTSLWNCLQPAWVRPQQLRRQEASNLTADARLHSACLCHIHRGLPTVRVVAEVQQIALEHVGHQLEQGAQISAAQNCQMAA